MASHLPKLADAVRIPFVLRETPPQPLVVYEPKPTPATTTPSDHAFWAARLLETEGERQSRHLLRDSAINRRAAGVALSFGIPLGIGAVAMTLGVGAAVATGATSEGAWLPIMAGPAWAALMGGGYALVRRANRNNAVEQASRLHERFADDLSSIEAAMESGSSLERAWLARRAETAFLAITKTHDFYERPPVGRPGQGGTRDGSLERWFPGIEKQPFGMRVSAIADAFHRASEEDRAQAESMQSICDIVFAPALRYDKTGSVAAYTTQVHQISDKLEWMMHAIEEASPEARALLKPAVANVVVRSLERLHGNKWRIKRFLESFDAKYTPYTQGERKITATLDLEELRAVRTLDPNRMQSDLDTAARMLMQQLGSGAGRARVRIDTPQDAESLAAYLEQQGRLRASIFEVPNGFIVAGYDPKNPPSGNYCRGEADAASR